MIAPEGLVALDAATLVATAAPVVLVDLDHGVPAEAPPATPGALLVGVAHRPPDAATLAYADGLDCTLAPRATRPCAVAVADVDAAVADLTAAVSQSPRAAATLAGLLRLTQTAPVADGLRAESLAYSMLLAAPEFRGWLAGRQRRDVPPATAPVLLDRNGPRLAVTLNRPERRNAFGREIRDGLIDAFDLVRLDGTVAEVVLRGAGPGFCSGGDLDEFGTTPDVATAHLIRLERSVAARIHAVRERVHAHLHGACIGAGIELPSFAGRVTAHPDTVIRLPELAMGLVPGAGGTVGITRRIGRWRCAYLALTGAPLDAATALDWDLVDALAG